MRVRLLLSSVILMGVTSCETVRVEGGCNYVREIKATYVCTAPGSKIEHTNITVPQ